MKKRILPALLALCMVMSLLPVSVFAGSEETTTPGTTETTPSGGEETKGEETTTPAAKYCKCGCPIAEEEKKAEEGEKAAKEGEVAEAAAGCGKCTETKCGCEEVQLTDDACDCKECTAPKCVEKRGGSKSEPCGVVVNKGQENEDTCVKVPANHAGPHEFDCTCDGTGCKSASHPKTEEKAVAKCGNTTTTPKGICDVCAASIAANAAVNCKDAEGNKVGEGKGSASCTATEHEKSCARACGKGDECTLTAGHSGDHKVTKCIIGAGCPKALGKETHNPNCPSYTEPEATTEKRFGTYTVEVPLEVSCICTLDHDKNGKHDGIAVKDTKCANQKDTVKVEVIVQIEWAIVKDEKDETKVDETKTAAKKAEAEKTEDDALAAELKGGKATFSYVDEAKKLYDVSKYVCPACADLAKADAEQYCTMAVTCTGLPSDPELAKTATPVHKPNCLSLCTHDEFCPNTKGDASAHTIRYQVYERVEKVTVAEGTEIETVVEKGDHAAPVGKEFNTLAEAKAYIASLTGDPAVTSVLNEGKTVRSYYSVLAKHCEKAGVVDSTVLAEDGTETAPSEEPAPVVPTEAADFADVAADTNAWYAEELTTLVQKGIFKGVLDTEKNEYNFEPKAEMNTETLVVLIARVLDKGLDGEGANWATKAVEWAAEEGLTEGVELGKITRGDVVLVLWRAANSPKSEQSLEKFADADSLEGDQLAAMKWAVEVGIIKGTDGKLDAGTVITRAQMVAVIARFDGEVNK